MARVTILVPNYNREASLRQCLEAVLAQKFQDWRLVVGDNASEDGSADVVRSLRDPRIRLLRRERNVGYVENTNLLLAEVDGEFAAMLHSDDWWESDYLTRMVAMLERAPGALIAVCAARILYDSGSSRIWAPHRRWAVSVGETILSPGAATKMLVRRWAPFTPSDVVARRELYQQFPRFDETLPYTNDWLMWARAASVADVALCPDPLVNNRKHVASVTGEADRDHRWAPESVRLTRTIALDWGANEPYQGALRELQAMNVVRMLAKAYELSEKGRRSEALYLARLARDAAPSRLWAGLAQAAGLGSAVVPGPVLRGLRRLAFRIGRFMAARRRREGQFRPSYVDSRHQLAWLLEDALTVLAESRAEPGAPDGEE
jgi:glycosyltransferase involved in cell wall biosynthesis